MELMPGYKHSDVGVIPDDWDATPLGSVLSKGRLGGNYANQDAEAELPLMKMGNLARGNFDLSKVQFIRPGVLPDSVHRLVYGDVLFNTRNTLDLVGKVAIWRDEIPVAYYNSNLMRLEFDPNKICSNEYANYSLNTESAISRLRGLATGTTSVAAIYTRDLLKLQILVPPRPEQRAIAQALSDVDALLATLDQMIAKKHDLKQATMQQLLTGTTRLPGFSGEWEPKKLEHAGSCLRGVTYRGDDDLSPHDTAFTKRLLRSNNVQKAFVVTNDVQFVNGKRVSQIQVLQKNDILICMANGSKTLVGKAGLFSIEDGFDYTFGAFMGCFRTDESIADAVFVFSLFQTGRYRDYINNLLAGSSINNLSPSSIESLEFSFPPYSEQVAIGQVLAEMDAELSAFEARRDKTRNIKQSMMQELLTGKTRLISKEEGNV
jgi:type I restriction enzyme S subunit